MIIGPGDSGKSTLISALELALAPRPVAPASDGDYRNAGFDSGFRIQIVVGDLTDEFYSNAQGHVPLQSWDGGRLRPAAGPETAVTVIEVEGTPDFEIFHWFVPSSGERRACTVPDRRRLFLSRLPAGDSARNELRLGRGSLLNRHMGDEELGGAVARSVRSASASLDFPPGTIERVTAVKTLFEDHDLVNEVALGLIAPEGRSLPGLVGLFDSADFASATPVSLYGQGTRRFALLTLAAALAGDHPIVTLDEAESGLEPYRQRLLVSAVRRIIGTGGQAFVTTHSPALIQAAQPGEIHLLRKGSNPKVLDGGPTLRLLRDQPLAFLSRVPVLCEGPTEMGMLAALLPEAANRAGLPTPDALGVELLDGNGQPDVFSRARTLLEYVSPVGLFLDNEDEHGGKRTQFGLDERVVCFTWTDHTCIEEIVTDELSLKQLDELVKLAADLQGKHVSDLLKQVASEAQLSAIGSIGDLIEKAGEAGGRRCMGSTLHRRGWFKKHYRGLALGAWLIDHDYPTTVKVAVDGFLRQLVDAKNAR